MKFHLLKNPILVLFTISDFAASVCFYIPIFSLAAYSTALGMKEAGPRLLTIAGIMNTVGRFCCGYISDKSWVNRFYLYSFCFIFFGIGKLKPFNISKKNFNFNVIYSQRAVYSLPVEMFCRLQFARQYLHFPVADIIHCAQSCSPIYLACKISKVH